MKILFIKYFARIALVKFLCLTLTFFYACDEGISPDPEVSEPGFSGTITFVGEWPQSVKLTHIVMFKDPLLQASDFNAFNLRYVSEEIPFGTQTYVYNSIDNILFGSVTPGDYTYLAVAQSTSETVSLNRADWFVAGVYYTGGDFTKPGIVSIPQSNVLTGIDIICDFNNPPPQPPGGP